MVTRKICVNQAHMTNYSSLWEKWGWGSAGSTQLSRDIDGQSRIFEWLEPSRIQLLSQPSLLILPLVKLMVLECVPTRNWRAKPELAFCEILTKSTLLRRKGDARKPFPGLACTRKVSCVMSEDMGFLRGFSNLQNDDGNKYGVAKPTSVRHCQWDWNMCYNYRRQSPPIGQ